MNETLRQPKDLQRTHHHTMNEIDRRLTEAKHSAENRCRKLKCGSMQWCPRVTAAINKILFWKSVLKHELGGKVGFSILKSRAKKAGLSDVPLVGEASRETIQANISTAYKHFKQLKREDNRCDTWISQLIAAQSSAWNKKKTTLWKQLRTTEKIRQTAHNVRRALHKVTIHKLLTTVIAPSTDATT